MNGTDLKEAGIRKAEYNANRKSDGWSDIAYKFLVKYAKFHSTFMAEEMRAESKGTVPAPPSLRAWGGVIARAKRDGIIQHFGYDQVKNPMAHSANASIWESKILIEEQTELFGSNI